MIDLALAVILGGAFGNIVTSFVEDLLMPALINPLLNQAAGNWQEIVIGPGIAIGRFLSTVVNFLIIALVLYWVVEAFEAMKLSQAENAEPTTEEKLNTTLERLTDFLESRMPR